MPPWLPSGPRLPPARNRHGGSFRDYAAMQLIFCFADLRCLKLLCHIALWPFLTSFSLCKLCTLCINHSFGLCDFGPSSFNKPPHKHAIIGIQSAARDE